MIDEIKKCLEDNLSPSLCEIVDFSHEHHGHGAHVQKGSHLRIILSSPMLKDKSRVQQHQLVLNYLNPFFSQGLHAVELELSV